MEDNYKTPSLLLSELKVLIGCQIIDMKKCSFDSYQDYTEYLDEVGIDHYRSKNSFFRYGFGSLLIEFNNNEKFDFAYVDELHSVVVLKDIDNSVLDDLELKEIISIKEFPQSSLLECLNLRINKINILTEYPLRGNLDLVPSESQIEFIFENKKNLILGLNLGSLGDFAIMNDVILDKNIKVKYSIE